jgi:hypothetical protein
MCGMCWLCWQSDKEILSSKYTPSNMLRWSSALRNFSVHCMIRWSILKLYKIAPLRALKSKNPLNKGNLLYLYKHFIKSRNKYLIPTTSARSSLRKIKLKPYKLVNRPKSLFSVTLFLFRLKNQGSCYSSLINHR